MERLSVESRSALSLLQFNIIHAEAFMVRDNMLVHTEKIWVGLGVSVCEVTNIIVNCRSSCGRLSAKHSMAFNFAVLSNVPGW